MHHYKSSHDDSGVWELANLLIDLSPNILKVIHHNGGAKFWVKHMNPVSQNNDICVRFCNVISVGAMGFGMTREQIQDSVTQELNIRFGEPCNIPPGGETVELSACSMEVRAISGSSAPSLYEPRLTT